MKQRDQNWREIRKHHVIPDKRDDEVLRQHQQEMAHAGRCPRCGATGRIEVHGHVQCASCSSVIDDCCQGEYGCFI